ncbi:mitochondrial import receptor subunit TOM20 homolog [Nilaparvata lugens]|uniref:mitochondrial import receptor subunit TOM20 homolog n=1 Tax=Nilaparvata lugens TaxID=108931 RepID=UPI000B994250|nr:mitochondrial import receptor subunit TOM20 homolog [Nilaparvata lugens]
MLSKAAIGIAAGICGTIFLGYCVYFDQKRRGDPNFKRKLKERRKAKEMANSRTGPRTKLPDMKDPEAVQCFFLKQIQMGEELLGQGDIDTAVDYLCNAVIVCGQPNQLLQVLQQTLPHQAFTLLAQRLPSAYRRVGMAEASAAAPQMAEEDVE